MAHQQIGHIVRSSLAVVIEEHGVVVYFKLRVVC